MRTGYKRTVALVHAFIRVSVADVENAVGMCDGELICGFVVCSPSGILVAAGEDEIQSYVRVSVSEG